MSRDVERIVTRVYLVDVEKTYERIERSLYLGDERGDYAEVTRHLDKAEVNARDAHKLYLAAKLEVARWEADFRIAVGAIKDRALVKLEEEKAKGTRTKRISIADVDEAAATMFPDEWRAQKDREARVKGAAAHLEKLVELCTARIRTLQVILSNLRK